MNLSEARDFLRKESLDIFNRLHSIDHDVRFVQQVHDRYHDVPLVPNLRCGAWYADPRRASIVPAYFKSTDGHTNNWNFNLRRPNLHLLPLIQEHTGIIVVDSTRSGKRMPDALSKTVPIWCAVINRALLPSQSGKQNDNWDTNLYTPPGVVSPSEHSHIEALLDGWAESLRASSYELHKLRLPLRPIWITPSTSVFPDIAIGEGAPFSPVICVSASQYVIDGVERRGLGFSYVQGSGDDHELWGQGLTPSMFWAHKEDILSKARSELNEVVRNIVKRSAPYGPQRTMRSPTPIARVQGRILLCALSDLPEVPTTESSPKSEELCYVIIDRLDASDLKTEASTQCLRITARPGKPGQAGFLRKVLPQSTTFVGEKLRAGLRICICCESGRDLSVGVALAAIQLFFDDNGQLITVGQQSCCTKKTIKTRLEWIIASRAEANPSRATLQRVNEFLLSPPSFWQFEKMASHPV
ncbi:initiator tRNA phosphoribosyl transferase [Punctularia strigosozonata HHB-11173 SS5]|uniref:initiator tRNA phosphoribosyl transferase n=1 Tax=Punctularia strigosozonata (strain HHB-11173) TaxID=741275 RepID=UPI0004417E6D|nr:initiator tRNA phosphoribosyl transferase [Punctularia strigosozonata HHB-11173 SS5]EIN06604.1 initiator tRNA phosphoribosyl transferase [Punctularia strigosozonata HHB-11173 SS5]